MAVSRPKVIFREIDGRKQEPFENVTLDVEEQHQGSVMLRDTPVSAAAASSVSFFCSRTRRIFCATALLMPKELFPFA